MAGEPMPTVGQAAPGVRRRRHIVGMRAMTSKVCQCLVPL